MLSSFTTKANHPLPIDMREYDMIYSDASFYGTTEFKEVKFIDFPATATQCGGRLSLFDVHNNASDYLPVQNFKNPEFKNVAFSTLAYFPEPLREWAKVERCGIFPCTGRQNIIVNI